MDEWLTPIDLAWRREAEMNHHNQTAYQDGATPQMAPDYTPAHRAPPQDGTAPQRAPHYAPDQYVTTAPQRVPPQVKNILFVDALQDDPPDLTSPSW